MNRRQRRKRHHMLVTALFAVDVVLLWAGLPIAAVAVSISANLIWLWGE